MAELAFKCMTFGAITLFLCLFTARERHRSKR